MAISSITSSCTVAKSHCQCFELLTDRQRALIDSKQVEIKFKKGEILTKQGTFANHVVFLCDGLVKVYLEDNNETMILKIMGPGNLIGLTSLNDDNDTFEYTAAAYVDSVARLIDASTFKKVLRENGIFASKIIQFMSENARQINSRFFFMTHRQSYGRIADLMLCLSKNIFKAEKFDLPLSRKELAELAGMSTESVVRVLKGFQRDNLINMDGKVIEIVDPVGLRKICTIG